MFEQREGRLFVSDGEVGIDDITDRYGTPAYIFSAPALRRAYARVKSALPDDAEIYFSLKANPNPHIANVLRLAGAGAELASLGELATAERAGFAPSQMVFAGPGKSDAELDDAVRRGIACINLESRSEANRLSAIAARRGVTQRVSLRINPADPNPGSGQKMGGKALPFGVDEELAADLLRDIERLPALALVGIHVFSGTQVLAAAAAATTLGVAMRLGGVYTATVGRAPEVIDVGLGLGVPLFHGDVPLDMSDLRVRAAAVLAARPAGSRLVVELGRYLTASAGVYVATVLDVKVSRGVRFVVLDGGMHHHAAAAGGFGNLFRKPYPIVSMPARGGASPANIVGPLCTPMDQFAAGLELDAVEPGDRIVVGSSGAYGLTVSPAMFLSHATPVEILVDGAEVRVIRERAPTASLFVP